MTGPAAAVVGVAEVGIDGRHGASPVGLMALAAKLALEDAGLSIRDVDGLCTASSYYYLPTLTFAEYLRVYPRYVDSTNGGGSSFVSHLRHAACAIEAGLCDVALIVYGSTQRSDRGRLVSMTEWLPYEEPYGLIHPISSFGLIAQRHMAEYGTTSGQLAEVAVAAREWAVRNAKSPQTKPLTIDDVLESPMVSTPLHRLDCCLVTDGGGAVVVTSAERAAGLRRRPVYVLGTGESLDHRSITGMRDLTRTTAADSASRAFAMAGVTPSDIDTLQLYDAFTICTLILLEDLGFCAKGEGGPFLEDGRARPGGGLPLNTNGGGLSYCHPGMLGIFLLVEAVEQLRGTAEGRQVEDAELALVHGMGATLAAHATAILTNRS